MIKGKNHIILFRASLLSILLLFFVLNNSNAQNEQPVSIEPFNLNVKIDKVGWQDFASLYTENGSLYLPVARLFEYLKINNKVSQSGKQIDGFYIDTKNNYKIDFDAKTLLVNGKTQALTNDDILFDAGAVYLSAEIIQSAFGINTDFDFRSLSAKMSANYEFPLTKLMKQENARNKIKSLTGEESFDAEYARKYHFFRPGMMDWSFTLNQSQTYGNENRFGLALGSEFLFGELSAWLYYSDKYGFNRNQQRYHWRWVDNDFKAIRQVQIGRIYNKNIATMLYPVDGFMITNAPTTVRKGLGTYQLAENTNPNWTVELYINNNLIDYTKADASGYFSFQVPIVYGTTEITLRYYGPNGEEQAERKTMNMPFNLLPKGEFEYRVSGGVLLNGMNSLYGRAETNLGLTRWMTVGAGYEYLSTIAGNPHIPFGNLTLQPFSRLILTGEYAHKVRYKGTMNLNLANNSMFELYYAKYEKDQKAIIYNFLEERMAGLTIPMRIKNVSGITKANFRQNIYPNFQYNTGELMFSAYYRNFNANLSNYINWTDFNSRNIYSNLSLSLRFGKGLTFRPAVMYSYTDNNANWYDNFVLYKAEIEQQILKRGYVSLGYEQNNMVNYNSLNLAFRYDFDFMSTYASAYYANKGLQLSESARGSIAFNGGNGYVHFDSRDAVSRSAVSIEPFIDVNFNGKRDEKEPAATDLELKCTGGKILHRSSDSIVRIVGLEPFVDYSISFDDSNFKNIAWKVNAKNIKVTTDPNQFKRIQVAVQPLGEMSGTVVDEKNEGVSRILVNIKDEKGKLEKSLLSESDGFFSYLGLKPGKYRASVDSIQLAALSMTANDLPVQIKENIYGDITDAGVIKLTPLVPMSKEDSLKAITESRKAQNKEVMSHLQSKEDSIQLLNQLNIYNDKNSKDPDRITKFDSLLHYIILFDFNSADVRSEFYGTIKQLGKLLRENESLRLEIQGHTDNVGPDDVNVKFSERRANSVKKMLVKYGISEDRLRVVGFGKKKPMPGNTNKTAVERSKNRRVVFKAISGKDLARFDSISGKMPSEISDKEYRTLKKAMQYETSQDPFEVKWRYMYSILFHYKSSKVRPEHMLVLKALANVLKQNPCLKIDMSSYTDPESSDESNMNLSIKRSQSVWDVLEYNGVDRTRVEVANYGESVQINNNENEAERALNRRVTFKVNPTGCQLKLDSLITEEILKTYRTRISNQIIINHDNKYMIQTGAFKSEKQAILMAIKLKDFLPDNIYIVLEDGVYRVIVGYTNTRKEALDIARVIQASGILANPLNN